MNNFLNTIFKYLNRFLISIFVWPVAIGFYALYYLFEYLGDAIRWVKKLFKK